MYRSELLQNRGRHHLRAKDFPRCFKSRLLYLFFIPLDLFGKSGSASETFTSRELWKRSVTEYFVAGSFFNE